MNQKGPQLRCQRQRIRYLFAVQGLSQRAIARELGISRNTVRKYCAGAQLPVPKPRRRTRPVITDEVKEWIQGYLEEDEQTSQSAEPPNSGTPHGASTNACVQSTPSPAAMKQWRAWYESSGPKGRRSSSRWPGIPGMPCGPIGDKPSSRLLGRETGQSSLLLRPALP
ncbi:helix-turn-helix domain-containing protein [Gelria sp. Kuro-4]|uniref:helix-turn-helix domain-containing protein n=1 Tax=Gelria sp. Kuro-4 TaxID=2796927 RepID=UPI0021026F0B